MSCNIVAEWLRSLHLGQYAESFIDNGYDDLEICKQVGDPDLDAIGVFNPQHRGRLLQSVRTLREEGAASVYFTLEETAAVHEECLCADNVSSARSSRTSSTRCSDKDVAAAAGVGVVAAAAAAAVAVVGRTPQPSPAVSSGADSGGGQEAAKYTDEYEEGKAELVKIPRMQLKMLLREKLSQDGIRLTCQPYSTTDGERGYLEGLASRYADLFSTHYGDVLSHLEDLRRRDWAEMSPRDIRGVTATPGTPPTNNYNHPTAGVAPTSSSHIGLTTSQSQPIYVPGKYSPSSCLSDKEEDEIYGFGYGVFGAQIARQQQRLLVQPTSHQPLLMQQQQNYQTCLSPRSAYFYEFPPNDQNYTNTNKKKTTFSRFLRGLKTSHRKEKHGTSSPRHGRAATRGVPQRVDTPDSVLQSGLGLNDFGQHAVLRSMVDPRDYDRLRHLQMNGATANTFEETIYKVFERLKLQDALRQREKFTKEHEEILRDIKQGLLQLGKEGVRGPLSGDDTYMYDEDARMLAPGSHDRGHWYDEPPYESDPEDFLMGSSPGPTATIQNGRVCFTLNLRQEPRGEGVISLRSAGDISLPRDVPTVPIARGTPRRGLILPQAGFPPTIIPLRSSRDRESGDYATSDVQSVSSRLSTLSVDTSRSEQQETSQMVSPQYYSQLEGKMRYFRKTGGYTRSEDGLSPSQSSDYEDQDEFNNCSQQIATVHMSGDGRSAGVSTLAGKVRGLREDVQRKISRLKSENAEQRSDQAFPCSASSVESLPSGSGSSTQALVRAGSNHSSISAEETDPSPTELQIIGRARALVDYTPSPYDKEALKFKKGDLIDIVSMNASGQWKGVCHGKKGTLKFINVELLSDRTKPRKDNVKWHLNIKSKPASVEDLLQKINLQEHISVFVLNGYEDLELFKEIEPSDLDYLGIVNTEHRVKILTAVQLLHDLDSGSEGDIAGSSSEGDEHNRILMLESGGHYSPFGRRQFPRDSGCYDGSLKGVQHVSPQGESDENNTTTPFCDATNNLDAVVEQCNNEIMARVRQAQKNVLNLKEEFHPNIPVTTNEKPSQKKTKDSYVSVHGQTTLTDPCRRNVITRVSVRKNLEEETDKLTSVKYVVGSGLEDSSSAIILGRGGCFSEKSSDSGVSSSSLSSANVKEQRTTSQTVGETCAKTTSATAN
ncbi:uncharacterized protein [Onthophagus taurus]|uniref:uncharacterized protein isoform X3 n=1 Tax=Onthophagus taurus TaxID=166361 RepID=UPI0039BE281C